MLYSPISAKKHYFANSITHLNPSVKILFGYDFLLMRKLSSRYASNPPSSVVIKAIRILNNPKGLNIGARHISVSTSGLVPRIYDLANENIQCTLSVSLHASNDEKRSSMMPVNNAYNIEELMKACRDYIAITNKRISFEYALAKDNNDNLEDAKELVNLLRGMICHVNLIPINKIENGKFTKSSNENIIKFRDYLNDHGIVATIRRELGSDIDAACGQLRRQNLKEQ